MRALIVSVFILASPASAEGWGLVDCTIVIRFAQEAVSEERNATASYVRSLEAMLDVATARLAGDDLDAVLDLAHRNQKRVIRGQTRRPNSWGRWCKIVAG
jgi:hypothetical protein